MEKMRLMKRAVINVPRLPTLSAKLPQIMAPTIIPAKAMAPENREESYQQQMTEPVLTSLQQVGVCDGEYGCDIMLMMNRKSLRLWN